MSQIFPYPKCAKLLVHLLRKKAKQLSCRGERVERQHATFGCLNIINCQISYMLGDEKIRMFSLTPKNLSLNSIKQKAPVPSLALKDALNVDSYKC